MIVAFEGLQPLDAVGPHEVFAGAGRAAAALGRAGSYRVTLASPGGATVRAESGLVLGTAPLPTAAERIDTLVLSGGPGAEAAAQRRGRARLHPPDGPALPACGHRLLGRLPRCGGRAVRRAARHHPLGPRPPVGRGVPRRHRRCRSDLHPRRQVLVERRGHGRHRPLAGAGPGGPRRRRRPDRRPLARDVPPPARRPNPVRVAGVGPPRRALDHPGRAVPRRGRPRRRPPAARARRRRRHERPALHAGLHRRGGRDPEPLRRAHPAGSRPPRARGDDRHARPGGGALRARQRRVTAPRVPEDTSACHPMPTGGASVPRHQSHKKGRPHDRPPADRHPALPEVHRARCRRAPTRSCSASRPSTSSSSATTAARCAARTA